MESINGLPNVVGLENLVSQPSENAPVAPTRQDQPAQQTQQTAQGTDPSAQAPANPEQPANLAQFKTPEALLAAYKELQGTFTKTAQERAALNRQIEEMRAYMTEQAEMTRLQQFAPPIQTQPGQPEDFDQQFIANPKQAVEALAEKKAQALLLNSKVQDVLEEESLKAPNEFQERYNFAKLMSQRFPALVSSSAGVRKLFQLGDKFRADYQRQQAQRMIQGVFGPNVDLERLRQLASAGNSGQPNGEPQTNLAYMPDSNLSTRTGADTGNPLDYGSVISEAAKKGDVDAVLKGVFQARGLK